MNSRFLSTALEEFEVATEYYKEIDLELGLRFRISIADAITSICLEPLLCPIYVDGIRRRVLLDFPYLIFYIPTSDEITIIAVMHQSREPDYWKKRLD